MLPKLKITFERWKWNSEHELWVSTEGRVKDRYKQEIKPFINHGGYMRVYSEPKKQGMFLHRLVLETWRSREDSDTLTVEHNDQNKRNNSLRNLIWMTEEENRRRARESSLTFDDDIQEKDKNSMRKISVNSVTMTVEDAVTLIYGLSTNELSKVAVREKLFATLNSDKKKKTLFGVTIGEVKQ